MLILDALVVLGVIAGLTYAFRSIAVQRTRLQREREAREHQVRILAAARDVAQLLLLDDDVAAHVYRQIEADLRKKGKLPPTGG